AAELGDGAVSVRRLLAQVADGVPVDPLGGDERSAETAGEPGGVVVVPGQLVDPGGFEPDPVVVGLVDVDEHPPAGDPRTGDGTGGERGESDADDHGWSPISRGIRRVRARSTAAPAAMPAARTRAAATTAFTAPPLGGTGRARRRLPGRSAGRL